MVRIVAALGGNALLQRGEKPDATVQRAHVRQAARALAPLTAEHEIIICHGNGPQVGQLSLESEADAALTTPYPLDVLGAETQGMIGYWLIQELHNAGVIRPVAAVITQTVVLKADSSFDRPTKFVGPIYTEERAAAQAGAHRWTVAADGPHWRRVVPSPQPYRIVEMAAIRTLSDSGAVVVCGGGGGAPVVESADGRLIGVDAVVDKDLTAALIAQDLGADVLLLLTDVAAVMRDFGTTAQAAIRDLDLAQLATMSFAEGSMGPKIEACRRFARETGRPAAIGALTEVAAIINGTAGTMIRR